MNHKEVVTTRYFTFSQLDQILADNYCDGLNKKDIEELSYCFHLLGLVILSNKKPCLLGKILKQDHPFDLFIVDKITHEISLKNNFKLEGALPIQLKTIQTWDNKDVRISVVDWVKLIQKQVDSACTKAPSVVSLLHLQNIQPVQNITGEEIKNVLSQITFPEKTPFTQVTFSMMCETEDHNSKYVNEMDNWQLYPSFEYMGTFSGKDMAEINKICGQN